VNSTIDRDLLAQLFVRPELAQSLTLAQWTQVLTVLRHEKLLARYALLLEHETYFDALPKFVQRHCHSAITLAERHAKQVHFELAQLRDTFTAATDTWLVLKGSAYTASGCSAAMGRVYNDIDILVDKPHLSIVERQLIMSGWMPQEIDDYDEAYYRQWTHEIPPLQHGYRGTMMDLHHNLVPPVSGRAPDMSLLFKHIELTDAGIPVLALPAMALHSAIHLFFNDDFSASFRDLTDLYLMFNDMSHAQWETAYSLALETGFATELALAMHCTGDMFQISLTAPQLRFVSTHTTLRQSRWICNAMYSTHPFVATSSQSWYTTYAWLRGHILKMPAKTLLYHLSMKAYRLSVERILGKHFFTKQDKGTDRVMP
jgi:hypothetical protein